MTDIVRVLRVIEFVGDREWVEQQIARSLQGVKIMTRPNGPMREIRAATIGVYPEILQTLPEDRTERKSYSYPD